MINKISHVGKDVKKIRKFIEKQSDWQEMQDLKHHQMMN